MATDTSTLTPAEWQAMLAENATDKPAARPALTPLGAPPAAPAPAPSAAPALPTVGAGNIPDLAKPTRQQSNAAGKAEYQAGLPQVTAKPFTPEWAQQQEELAQYKHLHPLGSNVSAMPGVGGKFLHGLGRVANIAGDILAPGITANIPGSDLYNRGQEKLFRNEFTTGTENEQRGAQTKETEEGNELVPFTNPATGETQQIERRQWAPLGAAEIKGDTTRDVAQLKADTSKDIAQGKSKDQLLKMGYDENGNPLPDEKLSPQQKAQRDLLESLQRYHDAQAELDKAKNDPNSPAFKQAQQRVNAEAQKTAEAYAALNLHKQEFANKLQEQEFVKPSGQAQSRGAAAGAALALLPDLQADIKKHGAEFGPIIGRINKGELHIGDVSPEVQRVYAELKSFYALQPAVHGFRNAEFVKDFDTIVGSLQTNPEAVVAGLDGLRPTLGAVSREGLTFHHRVKEGEAPAGGAKEGGPPAGAKVIPLDEFMKGPK